MLDLIIFVLVTVFWCLGVRLITEKGNLLYFLRKPFEKTKPITGLPDTPAAQLVKDNMKEYVIPQWIGKPLMMCISCMASVHGILIFSMLVWRGIISLDLINLGLGMVMASFIQTFIWCKFESITSEDEL